MFLCKPLIRFPLALVKLMILGLLSSFTSCNNDKQSRQIEPSFYYWKSVLRLTAFEKQKLDSLKVKTIYLKFFDVDWDEVTRKPLPVAKLQAARDELQGGITIIPTVFITNECIQKIDTSQVKQLAENMYSLILEIKKSDNAWKLISMLFICMIFIDI